MAEKSPKTECRVCRCPLCCVSTRQHENRASTRLNNHQAGRNGDRTLGQCSSSNARRYVFSEAAGCFKGRYTGLEEKDVFEAGVPSVPRAEPMKIRKWRKVPKSGKGKLDHMTKRVEC